MTTPTDRALAQAFREHAKQFPSPTLRIIERRAAEIDASKPCTCPSGDGSLRWPCPQHTAHAEVVEALVPLRAVLNFVDTLAIDSKGLRHEYVESRSGSMVRVPIFHEWAQEAALAARPAAVGGELPELPATRFWADSMALDRPGVFFEHTAELFVTLKCSRSIQFDQPLFTADQMHAYARTAIAATQPQQLAVTDEDARDARRWRAIIGSARIRVLGSAGLHKANDPYGNPYNGYAHIGLELWTRHDGSHSPDDAIEWLTKYADIAAALPHLARKETTP